MAFPAQLLLGILGNITSLALYMSPMVTFWTIYKAKSTKDYSGAPYVCTLCNCALWLLYGAPFVKPHSTLLLTINGAGFILEMFYLLSFLAFAPRKTKVMTIRLTLAMTIAFVVIVVVTIFHLHDYSARQLVVGTMCVILSIVMYASPLSVVKHVIDTKNVESMPFLLSLCNAINAIVWAAYSVITRDVFIAVPNGVGFILGMIQLTIYFTYRNSKPVLPVSTQLSDAKMIDNGVKSPIQTMEVYKSNATKGDTAMDLDPVIADQV